jgi:hypothetical protein
MATTFTRGFLYRARFTQAELVQMLECVKSKIMDGGPEQIMTWTDNGTTVSKRQDMTVGEWIDEITYSLALLNPDDFGDREASDMTRAAFPNRFD